VRVSKPLLHDHVVTIKQAERLLGVAAAATSHQERDVLLLELLCGCGLRSAEAVGLHVEDVDLEESMLHVSGKGSKDAPFRRSSTSSAGLRRIRRTRGPGGVLSPCRFSQYTCGAALNRCCEFLIGERGAHLKSGAEVTQGHRAACRGS
jgi:integrase